MLVVKTLNRQRPVDLGVIEAAEWPAQATEQLVGVIPLGWLLAPQPPCTGTIVT
ncbi:hypothetical protein D3C78_1665670 [compost metagenome]